MTTPVRNHLFIAACCLVAFTGAAVADTQDPGIGVIGGDPPATPFFITTQLQDVQPTSGNCDANGDCMFVFNNNTGDIITSLTFSTDIVSGLTPQQVASAFSCTQGVVGYFLNCNVNYDSGAGPIIDGVQTAVLTYTFSGVLPPEIAESCPTGNCAPDQRGIPPDTVPTDPEFTIELTGWLANTMVGGQDVFAGGVLPTFTNSFTATPEPSSLVFLGLAFLLTVGAAQFRRRKEALRSSK